MSPGAAGTARADVTVTQKGAQNPQDVVPKPAACSENRTLVRPTAAECTTRNK